MLHALLVTLVLEAVPPPQPCGPVPSPRQLDRLNLEVCALVHLGVPTFLDRDAARATDDPAIFRLGNFSAKAWIDDLRTMDLDGLVLVARDDDGFRLAETEVLPALRTAAVEARVPFGVSVAGRGSPGPLAEEIEDLCRRFGPFFTVRVGGDVSGSRADTDGVGCLDATITSSAGPDFVNAPLGTDVAEPEDAWRGIERAVSLRPSWYWRGGEDESLRQVRELEEAWFASVGRGEALLVGVPADRSGRFRTGDVRRIAEFRERLARVFDRDLAREAMAVATSVRGGDPIYSAAATIDGDDASFWATDDGIDEARLELAWSESHTIDLVELREPPALGRRARGWTVEARTAGSWREVAHGESIGFRRIARFTPVAADAIRIRIQTDGCPPALSHVGVFATPPDARLASGVADFAGRSEATLATDHPDATIRFTLDGRDPAEHGAVATGPIPIESSCLLRAVAIDRRGRAGHPLQVRFIRTDDPLFHEAAAAPDGAAPGLTLELHDGVDKSLDELVGRTPRSISTIDDVRLPADRPSDSFALVFRGFLDVPADGLYTFALRSDDGSRLYLDGRLVVERDGVQTYEVREGRVSLKRGLHPIRVEFCEFAGRESLSLWWAPPGAPLVRIPADAFVR